MISLHLCLVDPLTTLLIVADKGIGAHLLKVGSKRRRTQAEMKEQYHMEQLEEMEGRDKDAQIAEFQKQIQEMQQQMVQMETVAKTNQYSRDVVTNLVSQGVLELKGDSEVVLSQGLNTGRNPDKLMKDEESK